MTRPLVSVLVPTYNGEAFLRQALESALAQTYGDIEVLVGDDASTDGTAEIVDAAAAADRRVRVLRHAENVGPYENPRRLLQAARGEYVKFLLHDDLLHPRCVAELVAGMRANPSTTLAFSRRCPVDADGAELPGPGFAALSATSGVVLGRQFGDGMLQACANAVGELTTVLFRRADVDPRQLWHVDGRRLAALGDLALWLDLLARGDAFYTPDVLSSFRQHRTQRSKDARIVAGGVRDWPLVIDWARRRGFLADPAAERQAHAAVLTLAAAVHAAHVQTPDSALALEAVYLSVTRLVELAAPLDTDPDEPLPVRMHGAAARRRIGVELDVLVRRFTGAVAAPTPDAREVAATLDAFRDLARTGRAGRFVVAVQEQDVDRLVPLLEAALAQGGDLDVDLLVTSTPAAVLGETWLAVSPRGGGQWHAGTALSVLHLDPPGRTPPA